MEARAAQAGYSISRTTLSDYARNRVTTYPSEQTRRALAAALGVSIEEVSSAALASAAPELADGRSMQLQHARAFIRLTEGRTDQEITQLLGVVQAALRAIDAGR